MKPALALYVSPASGAPIYRQLVEQIRSQAAGGRFAPGEFLPSVRQVADELQINPMTVSKAYSILEREGVVELARGQGMRLKDPGPAANGKSRRQALMPLLEQVALTARQLNLTPQQVLSQLTPLLEEKENE